MGVSFDKVKKLRAETLAGIVDCKKALEESKGDMEKAKIILRKKGIKLAQKKSQETTNQGLIASYIHHNGRIGALVEVHCQSDFVARNREFQQFARDIAMHIAASNPKWISLEQIPREKLEEEKKILEDQAKEEGKPSHIIDKIVEGRMRKFYEQVCLLDQPYIKDEEKTVNEYLQQMIAKLGENIKIARFVRFELGEKQG
ncbi:translation elongation factor Ts [Candidatus Aerophobetes bacterium]|uniref:Elongation factor Ts n=1 Tax=Aerophobetes bacterium TaxID=2030807 RepID=A0A662DFB2_UNCAE|nr:MAG: translation elongation factor Ts [Candidatus Aerophobetes bacterium]